MENEALIYLIARAMGRASGSETPEVYAGVVIEHAKEIAAEDAAKAAGNAPTTPVDPASAAPQ